MLGLSYFGYNETRSYNSLLQMTHQTVSGMMDMQYLYAAGSNNGRITQAIDGIAGETVSYTYDALNRLSGATAGTWGQGFSYDGFGNLMGKTATLGSVPTLSVSFDAATNRMTGQSYDASGNVMILPGDTYDVENRVITNGVGSYGYDHAGKRVVKSTPDGSKELYFYGVSGQKLATFATYYVCGTTCVLNATTSYNVYFGGKLVKSKGVVVVTDRLGSVRANSNGEAMRYYPYGEERTSTADNREKFGTYTRDSTTQDYADQRYYGVGMGRFGTPDPTSGVNPGQPSSWNRYLYVHGDPVNFKDRRGLNEAEADDDDYYDEDHPFSGGGGAGPGWDGGDGSDSGHAQAFYKAATTLWKALDLALTKLDSDKCRSLFGNDSSPDPRDVLKGLLYGNRTSKYGMVTVDDIRDDPGKVTSATTKVTGLKPIDIGNGATQLVNGTVLITMNDLAGDFANGDVRESGLQLFFMNSGTHITT